MVGLQRAAAVCMGGGMAEARQRNEPNIIAQARLPLLELLLPLAARTCCPPAFARLRAPWGLPNKPQTPLEAKARPINPLLPLLFPY